MNGRQIALFVFLVSVPLASFAGTSYLDGYVVTYPGDNSVESVVTIDSGITAIINGCRITMTGDAITLDSTQACEGVTYEKSSGPGAAIHGNGGVTIINSIDGDLNIDFQ